MREVTDIPTYTYICELGHETDRREDYETEEIKCLIVVGLVGLDLLNPLRCGLPARRRPFYEETGVIFPGTGFTRTVIPPAPPKTGTKAGEPTSDWYEKLDKFAEDQYHDDENYRDDRKEQADKMIEQVKRGAIP